MELITIIINVYNGEKYIKKCLDSVINQTYKNLEILIVNDGSTDNTLSIINTYKDKRIRVINQKNIGLSLSRNVGIDNAKGDYLYFVDADDYIANDTIEYLYNLIKEYKLPISICTAIGTYSYDLEVKNEEEKISIKTDKEMLKNILFAKTYSGTTWNKLYKKELFNNIRFEDRIVNDVVTAYKLYIEANKVVFSNQVKYYYFKHSDSIVARREWERSMDMYKASLDRYYYIKEKYPDFIENEIGMLLMIYTIYYKDSKKSKEFYKKEKMKKLYNKFFTFKIIKSELRFNDKIKLLTFRVSPRLSRLVTDIYIKLEHKK